MELVPQRASGRFNLGLFQLLAGDYVHGWAGYESRWQTVCTRERKLKASYFEQQLLPATPCGGNDREMDHPYWVGYGVSMIAGIPVSWVCWYVLHALVEVWYKPLNAVSPTRVWWIPLLMGLLERALFTTLIGFSVSGAASFIGAWVTIKAVGGWIPWGKTAGTYERALFMASLLSSGVSAGFGITGGIIIALARQPSTCQGLQ